VLAFAAERAVKRVLAVAAAGLAHLHLRLALPSAHKTRAEWSAKFRDRSDPITPTTRSDQKVEPQPTTLSSADQAHA